MHVSYVGQQIKFWFAHYLDEWLEDDDNIELWESGQFPPSQRRILVTHLLAKAWQKVCSRPASLRRYFTKTGCGMTATGEDDDLISPQRFKAGEYSFEYAPDELDVQPTPQLRSAPEPAAPNLQLDETLGDVMLGVVRDDDGEINDDYDINEALEAYKRGDKEYSWVDEPEGGASSLKPGDTVLFNFEWGWERGVVHPMAMVSADRTHRGQLHHPPLRQEIHLRNSHLRAV